MSDDLLVTAAERLARLILCHGVQMPTGGGRAYGRMTAADGAAALAGLAREPLLFARIAWCGEWNLFAELERVTWMHIVEHVVIPQGWMKQVLPRRGHNYWRRMALLALCETLIPPFEGSGHAPCPACHGRPLPPRRLGSASCPVCRGARRVRYGPRLRARLVGMRYQNWVYWQPRYLHHVRPIPRDWEAEASQHVRERLQTARTA